jgi:hypothetical protein
MGLTWIQKQHTMCTITSVYSYRCTGLNRPWGFREVEAPRFKDNRHMKVVRLSVLRTGQLYPQGYIRGTPFYRRLSRPQGHGKAGDTIGNRNRNLPGCSALPQLTAPPRGSYVSLIGINPRAVVCSTLPLFGHIIMICINCWLLCSAYVGVFLRHSCEGTTSVQTKRKWQTCRGMHRIPAFSEVNDFSYLPNPSTQVILRNEQGISAEPGRLWEKFQCRWKVSNVHPH